MRVLLASAGVPVSVFDAGVRLVALDPGVRPFAVDAGVRQVAVDAGVRQVAVDAGVTDSAGSETGPILAASDTCVATGKVAATSKERKDTVIEAATGATPEAEIETGTDAATDSGAGTNAVVIVEVDVSGERVEGLHSEMLPSTQAKPLLVFSRWRASSRRAAPLETV